MEGDVLPRVRIFDLILGTDFDVGIEMIPYIVQSLTGGQSSIPLTRASAGRKPPSDHGENDADGGERDRGWRTSYSILRSIDGRVQRGENSIQTLRSLGLRTYG